MKKLVLNFLKTFLFCAPFLLGAAGFLREGETLLNALFSGLLLYIMQITDPAPNLFVEIARWTAPLATASGVLLAISSAWNNLQNLIRYRRGDSVAVYGPEDRRLAMLNQLGKKGIEGRDRLLRAQRYILLNGEEENFLFYDRHREKLKGKPVFLQCSSLPAQSASDPDLRLFTPEETAARQYWKERCLFELSHRLNHRLKVVFIGFDRLGEELLSFGLLLNIFDPNQRIEYHIFGDGALFTSVHTQLSSIGDPVIFYDDPWFSRLDLIEEADRVIVLTQEGQLALLRRLLLATVRREIHVFSAGTGLDLLAGKERLLPYRWQEEALLPERILGDDLYERAKRLNLRYAVQYSGAPDTEEAKETEWRKLDTFTRYSNISAADCCEIRREMLRILGQPSPETIELFARLEHIRWCRYHFLNNWSYGIPANGKAKDPLRRIHKDLIPYESLTEAEKQKDLENIFLLNTI